MKKRILSVILSLAAVLSLMGFNATEAWFSGGEAKSMILNSGYFDFVTNNEISFSAPEDEHILPGTVIELDNALEITNSSTIDTMLRIKIECEYIEKDENGEDVKVKAPWLSFKLSQNEKNWKAVNDGEVSYLYYCPKGDANKTNSDYRISGSKAGTITFNNNLIISGEVPPEMTDKEISFKVTLQAKQADIMDWSDFSPATEAETTTVTAE